MASRAPGLLGERAAMMRTLRVVVVVLSLALWGWLRFTASGDRALGLAARFVQAIVLMPAQ